MHDAILPVHFQHAARDALSVEPLGRLMCAIFADAMRCFQVDFDACRAAKQQEFGEAQFWIFSDEGGGPFSFEGVCGALKIVRAASGIGFFDGRRTGSPVKGRQ